MHVGAADGFPSGDPRSNVVVFTTGGTIGSTSDPAVGKDIGDAGEDVLRSMASRYGARVVPLWQRSSVEIGPSAGLELAERLERYVSEFHPDAVVVTTGTDTLEELCYLVDVTWADEVSCVFTASMLSPDAPDSDAEENLADAIRLAASTNGRQMGVLAVLDGMVHSARYLYKSRPVGRGAFKSYGPGPIGSMNDVISLETFPGHTTIRKQLGRPSVDELPFTPIVTTVGGDDGRLLRAVAEADPAGVVVCGTGAGNVTSQVLSELKILRQRDVPVVLASRTGEPAIPPERDPSPSRHDLREIGCVFADSLNGVKARLLLMLLVANNLRADLRQWFEACA